MLKWPEFQRSFGRYLTDETQELRRAPRLVIRGGLCFLTIWHLEVMRTVLVHTSMLCQSAPEVEFPRSGESLEHDVLLMLDEPAGSKCGQHVSIYVTLFRKTNPA